MRIKKLELKNFRGFEELTIDFPEGESGLAVFVGVNGSGKTTLLESIGFMLQEFVTDLFGVTSNNPIVISTLDININSPFTNIEIEAEDITIDTIHWPTQKWNYRRDFKGDIKSRHLIHSGDGVQRLISKNDKINLPLLAFYRTHRVVEEEENGLIRLMAQQLEAYHDAFDIKVNFRGFINWFIDQTNIENQLKIEKKDFEVTNQNLDAVRNAMKRFLKELPNADFSNLHVGVSGFSSKLSKKQTLMLSKDDKIFELRQLSEGERIVLLTVFDVAYRLASANPSLDNPLEGKGVILIDEIDLHLHPSWQRAVVKGLRKTFPNIQFILTTHSPQVLSNVPRENVFVLEDFKLVKHTPHTFGRDSNSILWELFGVRERPEEAQKEFSKLSRLLNDPEKEKQAKNLLDELAEKYGQDDSEVVRARLHFEFLTES